MTSDEAAKLGANIAIGIHATVELACGLVGNLATAADNLYIRRGINSTERLLKRTGRIADAARQSTQ